MRRGLLLTVALAGLLVASPALAAPTLAVTTSCAYSGGRFAVGGRGFDPTTSVTLDIRAPLQAPAGAAIAARTVRVDARGVLLSIFDVPPAATTRPVVYAITARRPGDASAIAAPLATTQVRTIARSVQVSGGGSALTAGAGQRWRVTGLPEGTPLYAHYRRAGRTVARRALGTAVDPCGRLAFDLRVLPRGHEHRGTWQVWLTADRRFRRPRRGVYVRRRLHADGDTARSRVRAAAPRSRLTPIDPRFSAPVTNGMAADATQVGLISLEFVGAEGAPVEFLERVGDRLVRLGTSAAPAGEPVTILRDATTWSCDRAERRFVATATLPGGRPALATYSVRTPSCAGRFALIAPRRVTPGERARIRIADRWRLGDIKPSLCVTPPGRRRACQTIALRPAVTVASRRVRASARGDWLVELRVGRRRVRRAVLTVAAGAGAGGRTAPPPTVLATGDSTMQGIDGVLADELGDAASVVSDVRIGSGISRSGQAELPGADDPAAIQWALLATRQSARLHQSDTIVSIGANDAFDMAAPGGGRVACCDAPWTAEYRRRVRVIMQSYTRGRRRVLWLTLPLPRDERRVLPTTAVNGAILAAAAGMAGVKVLRLDVVFTPDGYRDVMRFRGRDVVVRDVDGIHLNIAGTAIAARLVAEALARR